MKSALLISLVIFSASAHLGNGTLPDLDAEWASQDDNHNHKSANDDVYPGVGRRPMLYLQPRPSLEKDTLGLKARPYVPQNDQEDEYLLEPDLYFRTYYNDEYRDRYQLDDNNKNYFPYDLRRNYPGFTYRARNSGRTSLRRFNQYDYMNYL